MYGPMGANISRERPTLSSMNSFTTIVLRSRSQGGGFVSQDPTTTLVIGLLSSNIGWRSHYFFISSEGWEFPLGEIPPVRLNRAWALGISSIGESFIFVSFYSFSFFFIYL